MLNLKEKMQIIQSIELGQKKAVMVKQYNLTAALLVLFGNQE